MSMSPLVTKLKQALATAGIATGSTQDDVLMAATLYISGIATPEKGEWVVPLPIMIDTPAKLQFDVPGEDDREFVVSPPAPAKPKAKATKKKVAK